MSGHGVYRYIANMVINGKHDGQPMMNRCSHDKPWRFIWGYLKQIPQPQAVQKVIEQRRQAARGERQVAFAGHGAPGAKKQHEIQRNIVLFFSIWFYHFDLKMDATGIDISKFCGFSLFIMHCLAKMAIFVGVHHWTKQCGFCTKLGGHRSTEHGTVALNMGYATAKPEMGNCKRGLWTKCSNHNIERLQ